MKAMKHDKVNRPNSVTHLGRAQSWSCLAPCWSPCKHLRLADTHVEVSFDPILAKSLGGGQLLPLALQRATRYSSELKRAQTRAHFHLTLTHAESCSLLMASVTLVPSTCPLPHSIPWAADIPSENTGGHRGSGQPKPSLLPLSKNKSK